MDFFVIDFLEILKTVNINDAFLFYVLAFSATLTTAISKSGFGGAVAIGIPMLLLVVSPRVALGITLPILLIIDVWVVCFSKNKVNFFLLIVMSIFGLLGHSIGWYFFDYISNDVLVCFISVMSLVTVFLFFKRKLIRTRDTCNEVKKEKIVNLTHVWLRGGFWCTLSGIASFISVSGGIPLQIFLLSFGLKRVVYIGSAGAFFFLLNLTKIPLYWNLNILTKEILMLSITLIPAIPIGVILGYFVCKLMTDQQFYVVMHVILGIVGVQLLYGVFG